MAEKILLGYTGSFAFGMKTFYEMEALKERLKRNPKDKKAKRELERIEKLRSSHVHPVYISKKKYKKLKQWKEMQHYSTWM